jgi:hypothetical protein
VIRNQEGTVRIKGQMAAEFGSEILASPEVNPMTLVGVIPKPSLVPSLTRGLISSKE